MAVIEELQSAVQTISRQVGGSIVGIANRWGMGSGVVLEPGKVLTNAHNLRGEQVTVVFGDGRSVEARVAGADLDGDLAVLEVDTGDAPAITWDGTDAVGIGAPVFALSNPGGRGLRVTFGLVSGTERSFRGPRRRRIAGSIEHTAPLLPGSSGGPVVDPGGRFLGINTNRLGEGFYLAIPADAALRARVEQLGRGEAPERPRLGIAIVPNQIARRMRAAVGLDERDGVLVRGVEEDGPAARAGIREGDLITRAGDRDVATGDDLQEVLATATGSIVLSVVRGSEDLSVTVAL